MSSTNHPLRRTEFIIIAVVVVFFIAVLWPKGGSDKPTTPASEGPTGTSTPSAVASPTPTPSPTQAPAKALDLANGVTQFATCDGVEEHLKTVALKRVADPGFPWVIYGQGMHGFRDGMDMMEAAVAEGAGASASPKDAPAGDSAVSASGGAEHSTTNVQEAGIDEPALVKTNGKVIAMIDRRNNLLRIVNPDNLADIATIKTGFLPGFAEITDGFGDSTLLLHKDTLLVITQYAMDGGHSRHMSPQRTRTMVFRVDLSDPANPKPTGSFRVSASLVGARLAGNSLKLVLSSLPSGLVFEEPKDGSLSAEHDAIEQNRLIIGKSELSAWLPEIEMLDAKGNATGKPTVLNECKRTYAPEDMTSVEMTTIASVDITKDEMKPATSTLMASANLMYASGDRIVITAPHYQDKPTPLEGVARDTMAFPKTKFDEMTTLYTFTGNSDTDVAYRGSGVVPGIVQHAFNIDMHKDILRVASWDWSSGKGGHSQSIVTTFIQDDDNSLAYLSYLDGIGKKDVQGGVRWLTPELGAVITYERRDPLYLINTANPAKPKVAGELDISGYSAYLHPVGKDKLLGFGQEMDDKTGRTEGFKIVLFDIANPAKPKDINSLVYTSTNSDVEHDHTGLTFFDNKLYVPVTGSHDKHRPIEAREDDAVVTEPDDGEDGKGDKDSQDTKGDKGDKPGKPGSKPADKDDKDDLVVSDKPVITLSPHAQLLQLSTESGTLRESGTIKFTDAMEIWGMRTVVIGDSVYAISETGIVKGNTSDMNVTKARLFK